MKIQNIKRIVVIGCGGTGSILIPQLARFIASTKKFGGKLILADGDNYEASNADRQSFNPAFLGKNKAEYQALVVSSLLPEFSNNIEFMPKYLSKSDIESLIEDDCVVINCVDNNACRKFVEDKCLTLEDVIHICCGNDLRSGQVQIMMRTQGAQITPSIYKESPIFNSDNDDRSVMTCEQMAELPGGGQLICANMQAATMALNYFMQVTSESKIFDEGKWVRYGTVYYDCFHNSFLGKDELILDI